MLSISMMIVFTIKEQVGIKKSTESKEELPLKDRFKVLMKAAHTSFTSSMGLAVTFIGIAVWRAEALTDN